MSAGIDTPPDSQRLNYSCDLVCAQCRACAQTRPNPNELGTSESLRLIDQIGEFPRRPLIVLTGGDPLKRTDIFDLVDRAARRGQEAAMTPSATPLIA